MFRVNFRTGEMSICYVQVREEVVVCTPQTNPVAAAAPGGPVASAQPPVATRNSLGLTPAQSARP